MFRTELRRLIDNPSVTIPQEKKEQLRTILAELEQYVIDDRIDYLKDRIVAPHVDVTITTEFIEINTNRSRTAKLFLQIHGLLRDHFVPKELYRRMRDALDELHIDVLKIDREVGQELKYLFEQTRIGDSWPECSLMMCPRGMIGKRDEGRRHRGKENY